MKKLPILLGLLALTPVVGAQVLADPSFESQGVGTAFTAPWNEGGGAGSAISNTAAGGFPTDGVNFATVANTGVGPYTASCTVLPNATVGWISQDFGACQDVGALSFDWNWVTSEVANEATYNDFFAVRLFTTTGTFLADLLYVDTRDGNGTLTPACPSAGITLPFTFAAGEVQPAGPKNVLAFISGTVPGYTPGTPLRLVVMCGNRGDGAFASTGTIDNFVLFAIPSGGVGQANSAAASLEINGAGGGGCQGPFGVAIPSEGTLTMNWSGPAGMPLILIAGPSNPANTTVPCIGIVDIGTPPTFSDVVIVFDGTIPSFPNFLFNLNSTGTASQSFTLPVIASGTQLANVQGLVYQPVGSPCIAVLTASFLISVQ